MISVLLTLLKIIGITLLVLLGLLLLILVTVLFVPVRYRIKGYYKEEFVCYLRATWLLHLVTISVNFEKELVTSFKILGIDISSFINKKKDASDKPSEGKNGSKPQDKEQAQDKEQTQESGNTDSDKQTEEQEQTPDNKVGNTEDNTAGDTKDSEPSKNSKSIIQKITDFITGIRDNILSVYNKIKEIIINIKNKKDSVERYIRILQREEVKGAFSLCKKRILKMVKHLLPRHMKIHVHVGMEDPSVTGYILGAYSVLSDKLRKQIILQADFENVILEADYTIKGHCHAIRFLHEILGIVTDKNCRSFYKLVKKEIANERK